MSHKNRYFSILLLIVLFKLSVFSQQLDPAFGTNGVMFTAYPFNTQIPYSFSSSHGFKGFIRPNGGITVHGRHSTGHVKTPTSNRMRMITFSANGTNAEIGSGPNLLVSEDAAQQVDGKVVTAGSTDVDPYFPSPYASGNWFVERYGLDRQLDASFGSGGVVIIDLGSGNERATNIITQQDGKLVVSGYMSRRNELVTVVVRLMPNGTVDPTFGPGGNGFIFFADNGVLARKMIGTADGKILLLGMYYGNPPDLDETVTAYLRLDPDGFTDPTFGVDGIAYTVDSKHLTLADAKGLSNGDILVFSTKQYDVEGASNFVERETVLTKLDSSGELDKKFGLDGRVTANVSPPSFRFIDYLTVSGEERAQALLVRDNGTFVVSVGAQLIAPVRSAGPGSGSYTGKLQRNTVLLLLEYDETGKLIAKNFSGQTSPTDYIGGNPVVTGLFEQPGSGILVCGTLNPSYYDPVMTPSSPYVLDQILLARFSFIRAINNANNHYDFNFDGRADFPLFRPAMSGFSKWILNRSDRSTSGIYQEASFDFGLAGDIPVPGDYDGDGVQDFAVFRPNEGDWFTRTVYLNNCAPMDCTEQVHWGQSGDIPAPGDFDGDGKTDRAIFRPSSGDWYILFSSGGYTGLHFGQNGDLPVTGDYDGDGKSDVAVIRREGGYVNWYVLQSSDNQFVGIPFGLETDKAVPADYTGDGKTDIAAWRPSDGNWYVLSNYSEFSYAHWGATGDIPEPADYDGDRKTDFAIFRPSTGEHYALWSHGGSIGIQSGSSGDIPIASVYVR